MVDTQVVDLARILAAVDLEPDHVVGGKAVSARTIHRQRRARIAVDGGRRAASDGAVGFPAVREAHRPFAAVPVAVELGDRDLDRRLDLGVVSGGGRDGDAAASVADHAARFGVHRCDFRIGG